MFFFKKNKQTKNNEDQVEAIKKETYGKIDLASDNLKKVNDILNRKDVTLQIFYATRGGKGKKNG